MGFNLLNLLLLYVYPDMNLYPGQNTECIVLRRDPLFRVQQRLLMFSRRVGPCLRRQWDHVHLPMHGGLPQLQRIRKKHGKLHCW